MSRVTLTMLSAQIQKFQKVYTLQVQCVVYHNAHAHCACCAPSGMVPVPGTKGNTAHCVCSVQVPGTWYWYRTEHCVRTCTRYQYTAHGVQYMLDLLVLYGTGTQLTMFAAQQKKTCSVSGCCSWQGWRLTMIEIQKIQFKIFQHPPLPYTLQSPWYFLGQKFVFVAPKLMTPVLACCIWAIWLKIGNLTHKTTINKAKNLQSTSLLSYSHYSYLLLGWLQCWAKTAIVKAVQMCLRLIAQTSGVIGFEKGGVLSMPMSKGCVGVFSKLAHLC